MEEFLSTGTTCNLDLEPKEGRNNIIIMAGIAARKNDE
jgi:hypothetical protein